MRDLLTGKSVIPVIVIEREEDAVPLAQALVAGGLNILEITCAHRQRWVALNKLFNMCLMRLLVRALFVPLSK